jgi:predicted aspartyl protease
MSSRYLYDEHSRLMSRVTVAHPVSGTAITLPARVDTGADITLIPKTVKEKLELMPGTKVRFTQVEGAGKDHDGYFVDLTFEGIPFPKVRVVATDRDYALIGMDLLTKFKILVDGKDRSFTLEDP